MSDEYLTRFLACDNNTPGGPCQFIAPKFNELSDAETTVTFAKVDVDDADDVASDQNVRSMPTFKFFKDGQQIAEVIGADIAKLTALVAEHK
jgi:thioredoxin-like negative regulator of GroEL